MSDRINVMIVEDQAMPRQLFETIVNSDERLRLVLSIDNAEIADIGRMDFSVGFEECCSAIKYGRVEAIGARILVMIFLAMPCLIINLLIYIVASIVCSACNNADTLKFTWCVEVLSGSVSLRIDAGDYPVYTGSATIGCNYAIGSSNVPVTNFVSGVATAVGGAIEAGGGALSLAMGSATFGIAGDAGAGLGAIGSGVTSIAHQRIFCPNAAV